MSGLKYCITCGLATRQSCKGCNLISYCGREHQRDDWKRHKRQCSTLRLVNNHQLGRHLVASRDIEEGELLFTEVPIALGPRATSPLICLGCHNLIVEEDFITCPSCSWPMCSQKCSSKPLHEQECHILKKDAKKCGTPQKHGETPRYDLILILRCLLLKFSSPSAWSVLQGMESHVKTRKLEGEPHHVAAIRYLTEVCQVDFDVDTVHNVRGAIITNCYETRGSSGASLRGVYPMLGLVNHSCIPNTGLRSDKASNMYYRASVNIQKGAMLTLAYTGTAVPVWERQNFTLSTHYFSCSCFRCKSPTELDTYFSSPRCHVCGYIALVINQQKIFFNCPNCNHQETAQDIIEKDNIRLKSINSQQMPVSIYEVKQILNTLENDYHKKHYLWIQLAQRVIMALANHCSSEALLLKNELWENIASVFDVIEPGSTRRRGMILLELGLVKKALQEPELETETGEKCPEGAKNLELLHKAEVILSLEPPDSHEEVWLQKVRVVLKGSK